MNDFAHKKVAEMALNLAFADEKYYFSDENKQKIIDASILPDRDEIDGAYVHHFYNPVTELNFAGGRDHAINRTLLHLAKSDIKFNENGEVLCNPTELGRAIHFLTDLSTPVHTGYEDAYIDTWFRAKEHLELEKAIDNVNLSSFNNFCWETKLDFKTCSDLCEKAAKFANTLYFDYLNKAYSIKLIAHKTFVNAVVVCTNFLESLVCYKTSENKYGYVLKCDSEGTFDECLEFAIKDEKYRLLDYNNDILVYEKPRIGMNYKLIDKI
jgi:hypothetical protein